jgi:hypothetical protein
MHTITIKVSDTDLDLDAEITKADLDRLVRYSLGISPTRYDKKKQKDGTFELVGRKATRAEALDFILERAIVEIMRDCADWEADMVRIEASRQTAPPALRRGKGEDSEA